MSHLPVIVGFGGINAAGRTSFHHGYRRLVAESLNANILAETQTGLATLMGLATWSGQDFIDKQTSLRFDSKNIPTSLQDAVMQGTLIRHMNNQPFSCDRTPWQKRFNINPLSPPLEFETQANHLPEPLPTDWVVTPLEGRKVKVRVMDHFDVKINSERVFPVQSAGMLPTGFDPSSLYPSRNHPRGLQMTVYGASDALNSVGVPWDTVMDHVKPDQVAVYAGSAMGQLDYNGNGGMLQARLFGKKVTSKQCALGFTEMPADFINAYLLGSVGCTGTSAGACATFLYNLRTAVDDIQSGKRRVVIVGTSEAPITAEIADGYAAMGALGTDAEIMQLDGTDTPNHRRASRPFGENCGFTIAESAQFIVLFDDTLALELGANIHGAVGNVFVNADGFKKSISSPGAGNYVTVAKAVASARALLGEEAIQQRSFIQAHGSSTPQNRITESHILNETAKAFGIEHWPISAVKSYLGHTIGSAAGDQLTSSLGVWQYGFIPGIKTIDGPAEDVYQSHLHISNQDIEVGTQGMDVAFLNAKGFGGNNATASVLSPHVVEKMLNKKHGSDALTQYQKRNEAVASTAKEYDQSAIRGINKPTYLFDHNVIPGEEIQVSKDKIHMPGFSQEIDLNLPCDYPDMVDE